MGGRDVCRDVYRSGSLRGGEPVGGCSKWTSSDIYEAFDPALIGWRIKLLEQQMFELFADGWVNLSVIRQTSVQRCDSATKKVSRSECGHYQLHNSQSQHGANTAVKGRTR